MANSVGTVSIDLEARIAKFESDLGRAARIAEQRSNEMRKTLSSVAAALGAGLSIAGIGAFVKHALDAQDAISKLSQKVGISTEKLSGYQLAAKQAGVEGDSFQKGLVKLAQSAALAADGSQLQTSAFKAIGLTATDAHGKLKPLDTLFSEIAGKMAGYKDSTEKTVIATRLFGKAGADLIPLLNGGKQGLADYIKMADDFGLTVGSTSAKAAERFNDSLEQLHFVADGVANQIAGKLAPALAELADKAVSFFRSGDWKATLNAIASGAQWAADNVGKIIGAVKLLGEIVAVVYAQKLIRGGLDWIANLIAQGVTVDALGAKTALSLGATAKKIGLLQTSFNLLGAAVVGWEIGTYLYNQFQIVRDAGAIAVGTILVGWVKLKEGATLAWLGIKDSWVLTLAEMQSGFYKFLGAVAKGLQGSAIPQLQQAGAAMAVAVAKGYDAGAANLEASLTKTAIERLKVTQEADKKVAEIRAATWSGVGAADGDSSGALAGIKAEAEGAKDAINLVGAAAEKAAAALRKYHDDMDAAQAKQAGAVADYVGKGVSPDVQAWNDYVTAIQKASDAAGAQIKLAEDAQRAHVAGADAAKVESQAQQQLSSDLDQLSAAYALNAEAARKKMDVAGTMIQQMDQETRELGMSERAAYIYRAGIQAETEYRKVNIRAIGQTVDAYEAQVAAQKGIVEQHAALTYDTQKFIDFQKQVAQEYQGFWENASSSIARSFGDLFTGQTKSWKDFGSGLKSIAQQFVSDIIAQFVRLRVLGPLMSGAMGTVAGWLGMSGGGGGSILQIAADYYGNGGTVGSAPSSTSGAGGSGGTASYGSMVQNIQQARSLYSYFFGGGSAATSSLAGAGASYTGAGSLSLGAYGGQGAAGFNGLTGTGSYVGPGSTSLGAYGGNVTYSPYGGVYQVGGYAVPYASIGGGLMGAYYGAHQGDGSYGTVGSTVAYGALGAGVAGTAAGVAGGLGIGSAAMGAFGTTAGAAGVSAGAAGTSAAAGAAATTSWIPIVGWIAALAALADHFSGGKVFGTKMRTDASNVALNIGPDGSSADASVHQWRYKSGLETATSHFGINIPSDWGAKAKQTKAIAVTPEMSAAAQALYDNIEKTLVSGAQKLGVDVPAMLEASLSAQSTYNKKGKLTGTSYVVDYLGRTWKEATADAAAQRIGAEALVKVVEASAGAVAQSIAEQFRSAADTLLDGATAMLEAQRDITKGNSLVALGATATLAQVIEFTKGLQADGEKLADTYTRLAQASAAYLQFVGGFKPAAVGFGASLQAINTQMLANIDQANQLAQAAGMQGAREEDLANIHSVAAHQAADAIAQLSAAAQDLATKLYGATGNTLAGVMAQIDKLNAKVASATQLAIGDNSPLNDKEKLDIALKGLRSGITSADDVLALGRKLYASSADYTGLYNKVTEIMGLPTASGTGAGSVSSALTDYNKLIGQRDQYQSQADALARYNDAKTLAQDVADISTTHGIGYGEAASGLGFSLQDLAKDLGLTNISGYLDTLKQQDVAGTTLTASTSIVDAIQQLGRDLIQTITNGPLVTTGPTRATTTTPASDAQLAVLQSINDRLAALEGPITSTATTNKQMASSGTSDALRRTASLTRAETL